METASREFAFSPEALFFEHNVPLRGCRYDITAAYHTEQSIGCPSLGAVVELVLHCGGGGLVDSESPGPPETVQLTLGTVLRKKGLRTRSYSIVRMEVKVRQRYGNPEDKGRVLVTATACFGRGDILCVDMGLYFHYGVFTGDGVIHFWGGAVQFWDRYGLPYLGGFTLRLPTVQKCSLEKFR
eukprot:RCo018519